MARLPRLTLPGHLHHVIQRGNNGQAIFGSADDRRYLIGLLETCGREFEVAMHGYVLMDSYFHLLATPESDRGLPNLMQAVGRRYVRYFNDRQGRTGTLWDGRYRSTLIQADRYLLACMVFMDLSPVRDGIVTAADQYPWSSCAHYVGRVRDRLVTPHPLFWSLGNTPFAREQAYGELVAAGVSSEVQSILTSSTLHGWAAGDAEFLLSLARTSRRRAVPKTAGRPRVNPA